MVDYYDPLAVSAIGGNALSSTNNPRLGLYSPVNISQHATSPANAANIAKVGFNLGFLDGREQIKFILHLTQMYLSIMVLQKLE